MEAHRAEGGDVHRVAPQREALLIGTSTARTATVMSRQRSIRMPIARPLLLVRISWWASRSAAAPSSS